MHQWHEYISVSVEHTKWDSHSIGCSANGFEKIIKKCTHAVGVPGWFCTSGAQQFAVGRAWSRGRERAGPAPFSSGDKTARSESFTHRVRGLLCWAGSTLVVAYCMHNGEPRRAGGIYRVWRGWLAEFLSGVES